MLLLTHFVCVPCCAAADTGQGLARSRQHLHFDGQPGGLHARGGGFKPRTNTSGVRNSFDGSCGSFLKPTGPRWSSERFGAPPKGAGTLRHLLGPLLMLRACKSLGSAPLCGAGDRCGSGIAEGVDHAHGARIRGAGPGAVDQGGRRGGPAAGRP
jgi:hypothetical protein